MSKYGFVYCVDNLFMPGLFKIGFTDRSPRNRLEELSNSPSVPAPFDLLFFAEVEDAFRVEQSIHAEFNWARVSKNREFFQIRCTDLYYLLAGMTSVLFVTSEGYVRLLHEQHQAWQPPRSMRWENRVWYPDHDLASHAAQRMEQARVCDDSDAIEVIEV
ncbi:GIY-YIG nuclease family protein [uncultured Pseudomonas sp.]|uniref:GIY-YIG nuclease family protein n=1 Tax=uncultured Pseudomonas sp. TaxID=114707 RepID=UPI0025DC6F0E|nr:GIY-YIG nuclease family protein [uncultured Pseudomonas sp.]